MSFSLGILGLVLTFFCLFFFFGGGGGWWSEGKWDSGSPWVVSTSGLLPENTGIQREMNSWGGGAIHDYSSLYITKVNPTSRSTCDFQTLILTLRIS